MPRSSRHKSHKPHKHSFKDAREHSESEEDGNLKDKKGREEAAVRVSRDSTSGEKRKLVSQTQDGKDLFGPGNGDLSEEYVASKRRRDRADAAASDRWNGGEDERGEGKAGDKETKREGLGPESEKGPKSKVSIDSKSKSSRRDENMRDRKEENEGLAGENDDTKKSSSKVESKRKLEKDSVRKEVYQYKDAKEERGEVKDRKVQDVRRERSIDAGPGTGAASSEVSRKQGTQSGDFGNDRPVKQEVENSERQIQEGVRNPELEKELEKRIRRRRDSSGDKDKYQNDVRDSNDKRLSSRDDNAKNGKSKDERHKEGRYRDRENPDRDCRHRDDKHRDERSSKDCANDRSDTKHLRDENRAVENHYKKSKPQGSDRDGSPHPNDRGSKYKDNRGKKRSSDENEDHSDFKSRSTKDHRSDVEKKSSSNSKLESLADRARSQSRHVDVDSTVSNNRWKSSPSTSAHVAKDQYGHSSKQPDLKYRDSASEERVRPTAVTSTREVTAVSAVQERISESRSLERLPQKGENHLGELSTEMSPRSDARASPKQLTEKSPSSTSIDRRSLNKTSVRQSLDVEEMGWRTTGSMDARDYSANEERGSREFSLAEGDSVSVSSSFNRTGHLPGSSSSYLPPPPTFRSGVDSPSLLGSSEEDRSKSTNRFKRSGDPSGVRGQGNTWKGVTNWSSPVPNGYIPFQHGPPPGSFHAVMHQYSASPLFGVRPSMELNHAGLPYHIPDADRFSGRPFGWGNPADDSCPPHMHGWDGSNGVFGDDSHMYGRPDWDQNRHLMSGSADMWKGQNGGLNMELSTASQEEYLLRAPAEENWAGQLGSRSRNERNRPGPRAESIEIKRLDSTPPLKDTSEAPPKTVNEKTLEACKISSDDGARFYHIYLSKLDISVDLTHSELYDQCMGLSDIEGKTSDGEDVTKHVQPVLEKDVEAGANISNTTSSASLFPAIKDSVFQRAMALYKKETEEMRSKLLVSPFPELEPQTVPTSDSERLEHIAASDQEKVEDTIPISNQEEVEGPVPIFEQEEPVPIFEQEPVPIFEQEEPVLTSIVEKMEISVSTLDEENAKIPTPGEEKLEARVPTSDQDKEELVSSSNKEKSEEAVGDHPSSLENASQAASNSPSADEDINDANKSKGNPYASSAPVQQAFSDIMCGPLGFSDGSEACEVLMPESIVGGLVNLSRIHHSPESTH